MDEQRFDNLTRALAVSGTRRGVVRGLAAGLVGGLTAAFRGGDAMARSQRGHPCETDEECGDCLVCRPDERRGDNRCVPTGDGDACGECGSCRSGRCLADDDACATVGCARCDSRSLQCVTTCRTGQVCCADNRCHRAGTCCPAERTCDDACCGEGEVCQNGTCVATPAGIACPACGTCRWCDIAVATDIESCEACEEPCLAASLCATAGQNAAYLLVDAELRQRGFVVAGEPEAIFFAEDGIPVTSGPTLGTPYANSARGEDASLLFVPDTATSIAVVRQGDDVRYGLHVDDAGQVQEISAGDAQSFMMMAAAIPVDPVACKKCHDACEAVNSPVGNAVVCTVAGAAACARARRPVAVLGCGIAAAAACNAGGEKCSDVICGWMQGCPQCDPICERFDADAGACITTCTKPNSHCFEGECVCSHTTCGDACCAENLVCQDGACVEQCNPCWFPDNQGQCGNTCQIGTQEPTTCCVGPDYPQGTCCLDRERCCTGTCTDVTDDRTNCGDCGVTCGECEECRNGSCVPLECASGHRCCGDLCVNATCEGNQIFDEATCSCICPVSCPTGLTPNPETCECECPGGPRCGEVCCGAGQSCCNQGCCDGPCDAAGDCCPVDQICESICCAAGQSCCADGCCDRACDENGLCGCPPARLCSGACCADGETCCNGACRAEGYECICQPGGSQPCEDNSECCEGETCCGGQCCDGNCLHDLQAGLDVEYCCEASQTTCSGGDGCCDAGVSCCYSDLGLQCCDLSVYVCDQTYGCHFPFPSCFPNC